MTQIIGLILATLRASPAASITANLSTCACACSAWSVGHYTVVDEKLFGLLAHQEDGVKLEPSALAGMMWVLYRWD